MRTSLLLCLLLVSCGSSGSQDYHVRLFAVNVPCDYAAEVQAGITAKLQSYGIPFSSELAGCIEQEWPYYFHDQTEKALLQLRREYGDAHFIVPRFGIWFAGIQNGNASLASAAEGRLVDSVNISIHEILHQFGADHIFDPCNVMGAVKACDNPPILDKTLREIGL